MGVDDVLNPEIQGFNLFYTISVLFHGLTKILAFVLLTLFVQLVESANNFFGFFKLNTQIVFNEVNGFFKAIYVSLLQHRGPPALATHVRDCAVMVLLSCHPLTDIGVASVMMLMKMPVPTAAPHVP